MILSKANYLFVALPTALLLAVAANAQEAKQMVQQVVTTELTAGAADKSLWLYREIDQTPKHSVTQWVAETPETGLALILEENSQKLSEAQQRQKMEAFLRDKSAQAKERKKQQDDIKQTVDLLKLLPVAFLWTTSGSEGDHATLHFKPDPAFHPPTAQARILASVEGDLILDTAQHRIVNLRGKLIHDVKFGGGLLGEIKSGGSFAIERKEIAPSEWQIVETHVHFDGHMLLFKSVSEQDDNLKANFKPLPPSLTMEQAESELLKTGDMAKN